MKWRILILLLLLIPIQTIAAQPPNPLGEPEQQFVLIQSLSLEVISVDPLTLGVRIIGDQVEGCTNTPLTVTQKSSDNHLVLEIFREIPAGMMCPLALKPYVDTIPLDMDFSDDGDYTLDVNGTLFDFSLQTATEIEGAETPPTVEVIGTGTRNAYIVVEVLRGILTDQTVFLLVEGMQTDGCEVPYTVEQQFDADQLTLDLFRTLPPETDCVRATLPVMYTIPISFEDVRPTIVLNQTHQLTLEKADDPMNFRVPHTITDVQALVMESFPMQVSLEITGFQSDGCEVPVMIEQSRLENTITVEIFRELSPAMTCLQVAIDYSITLPLDGDFVSGEYTIIVNDFELKLNL